MEPPTFHERQRWYHCGVHAVNNLLQQQVYSASDFETISEEISALMPGPRHKALFGMGCYSADVVCAAVQRQGLMVDTMSYRNEELALERLEGPCVIGALLSEVVPYRRWWQLWRSERHWLAAVRRRHPEEQTFQWWVIDSLSSSDRPRAPLDTRAFLHFILHDLLECVVFVVERQQ
ncbi:Josephin domain containing 2 [Cyanidiococcus yangmingshanensis]|uniref:ubiquitinyl hydrolase 1 n=1 Tax=Cyanidiococcus yangmingshanensis TaxID=2690220 RepID=A0A7J7IGM9_9RHOD|nr:Josephin domain containing 2 [Cyanidiococcus yangmingshanensis]